MPECQNRPIAEIVKVQPNTVVVLHNGSPVEMPWADDVRASWNPTCADRQWERLRWIFFRQGKSVRQAGRDHSV
ncbi:MAG: hypothetical protein ACLRMZ_20615 [Blautia marasmi]